VVERDGDLLGDGVNIAARLEGLAESRHLHFPAVHEQVANKLSVQFADIGAQEVKNIPTPVHAYMVAMRREDGTYATPQVKKPVKPATAPNGCAGRGHAGVSGRNRGRRLSVFHQAGETLRPRYRLPRRRPARIEPGTSPPAVAAPAPTPEPTKAAPLPPPAPLPPSPRWWSRMKFVAAAVPFIQRSRARRACKRICAGRRLQRRSRSTSVLQRLCHRTAEWEAARAPPSSNARSARRPPSRAKMRTICGRRYRGLLARQAPVPPLPWIRRDPSIEQPFVAKDVPLTRDFAKNRFETLYVPARKNKAIAVGQAAPIFS